MKHKLLITYASYGSGHKSVAEYVEDYFKEHSDNFEVKIIDVMDYASVIAKIDQKIFNLNFKYQTSIYSSIGYEISDNKIVTAPYKEITKINVEKPNIFVENMNDSSLVNKQNSNDFVTYNTYNTY